MNKKYKYLSKNFILFGISSFGPKIIAFLMVPLYTNCLSTADYGIGDIVSTSANLVLPIIILCIESAILRFCFDKEYESDEVISSGLFVCLKGMVLCAICTIMIGILPFFKINTSYLVAFYLMVLSTGLYNVLTNYARGIDKVQYMVEMSLITTIASCVLNVVLLVLLKCGLNGYLIANYLGTFMAVAWGSVRLKIHKHIKFNKVNKTTVKELQKFGFPLIFNKIGWWINSSSDRYIVTWILGATANGIYTVSYKIPTMLTACSDIFTQAWQLSAIKDFDPEDSDHFVADMYEAYNGFLVLCCSMLIILTIPFAHILYAKSFFVAWKYVPPLMISFVFGGLAGFLGSIFTAVKDTKIFSYSTMIGAVVNTILNFVLVSYIGVMGAAVATLVSNIVIWLVRLQRSKRYIHIRVNFLKHTIMYILLVVQFIVCLGGFTIVPVIIQLIILVALIAANRKLIINIMRKGKIMLAKYLHR